MRFLAAALGAALACTSAFAATFGPVAIPPMQGQELPLIANTVNVTGSCGSGVVRLMGAINITDETFGVEADAGKVIVRAGPNKELTLDEKSGVLSDFNGIACVPTSKGFRLMVWSKCGGSACGESYSFFIVDPDRAKLIAPANPLKGRCNDLCATQLLGSSVPMQINGN